VGRKQVIVLLIYNIRRAIGYLTLKEIGRTMYCITIFSRYSKHASPIERLLLIANNNTNAENMDDTKKRTRELTTEFVTYTIINSTLSDSGEINRLVKYACVVRVTKRIFRN